MGHVCRTVADCSVIIDFIWGLGLEDSSSKEVNLEDPFGIDIQKLTVWYLKDAEMEVNVKCR